MVNEDELLDLMAVASWLYYEKQMTHDEIAHELSMNRVGVTRLLQKARQQGIVKFTITRALPHHYELSKEIQQKYHLAHVVIVQSGGDEKSTMNALGKAGAEFLDQQLFDGCRLGMAWSKTVSSIGNYLHQIRKFNHLTIHELAGTYLMDGISYGGHTRNWNYDYTYYTPQEIIDKFIDVKIELANGLQVKYHDY